MSECNLETSVRMRPRSIRAVEPLKKEYLFTLTSYMFQHSCGHLQAVHIYKTLIYTANIVLLVSFFLMFFWQSQMSFLKAESLKSRLKNVVC